MSKTDGRDKGEEVLGRTVVPEGPLSCILSSSSRLLQSELGSGFPSVCGGAGGLWGLCSPEQVLISSARPSCFGRVGQAD